MSPQPARRITCVKMSKWGDPPFAIAKVVDPAKYPDKGHKWLNIKDLTRVELIPLAKACGVLPTAGGNTNWLSWDNDGLVAAITYRVDLFAPEPINVDIGKDAPTVPVRATPPIDCDTVEPYEPPAAVMPPPAVPSVVANDAAASKAIADLVAALTPQAQVIDEPRIRAIVDDAVIAAVEVLRPKVTRIELTGREPVDLPGAKHVMFERLLRLVAIRSHVYLVGPPGTGKSTLAHQCADALGLSFSSLSLGPTTPASRIWGYMDANGQYVRTAFREAYEHGGIYLMDEMDNGHAGILAELNQALANGGAAFPDKYIQRSPDFVCIAAANTYGTGATSQFIGRNALDAATMDRFVTVWVPIDLQLEENLAKAEYDDADRWITLVRKIRANAEQHGLKVVVSPRAVIEGARMLAAGFTNQEVLDMRVLRGVTDDQRIKLMTGVHS